MPKLATLDAQRAAAAEQQCERIAARKADLKAGFEARRAKVGQAQELTHEARELTREALVPSGPAVHSCLAHAVGAARSMQEVAGRLEPRGRSLVSEAAQPGARHIANLRHPGSAASCRHADPAEPPDTAPWMSESISSCEASIFD